MSIQTICQQLPAYANFINTMSLITFAEPSKHFKFSLLSTFATLCIFMLCKVVRNNKFACFYMGCKRAKKQICTLICLVCKRASWKDICIRICFIGKCTILLHKSENLKQMWHLPPLLWVTNVV